MRCPKKNCRSKDMQLADWGRMTNQMRRVITNPFSTPKVLRVFLADNFAHMYKCADCGHRFARCSNCHHKWPITGRTEAGETHDCPDCDHRVVYVGRHFS